MSARNRLLLILLGISVVVVVAGFIAVSYLRSTSKKPTGNKNVQNPFSGATNPFGNESTYQNPFEGSANGSEYKNPFESLR